MNIHIQGYLLILLLLSIYLQTFKYVILEKRHILDYVKLEARI